MIPRRAPIQTELLKQLSQLGLGHDTDRTLPTRVPGLQDIQAVAAGAEFSLALSSDGTTVWSWGGGSHGELGDSTFETRSSPGPVRLNGSIRAIAAGAYHALALGDDGTVWTWGANFSGKLGIGLDQTSLTNIHVPVEVHGPANASYLHPMKAALAGEVHNLAVSSDGTVWAWGNNMFGQLGNGTTNASSAPVQVSLLNSVTALGGRGYHSLAIQADGSVWAWGWNSAGELGNGTSNFTLVPVQVVAIRRRASARRGESATAASVSTFVRSARQRSRKSARSSSCTASMSRGVARSIANKSSRICPARAPRS